MRLNPRFYSHPSRELMRLKKGLIKIWGNLAKKQNKTKHKTSAKKEKKPSMYTKEVSINDGSGDGQMPNVHFCPLTSRNR